MDGIAQDQAEGPTSTAPLLFISHRHADREIADAVRRFVTDRSGGRIKVYQSSAVDADERPRAGRELNQELKDHLWRATVVVLVFTSPDEDWSYCMWECGVATLAAPETRIIVFQCGSQPPSVYGDSVRVNARDEVSVQGFATDFLTNADFFPAYGEAVAPGFTPNGPEARDAGQQLHQSLRDLIQDDGEGEDWTTMPFMRLQLSYAEVDQVRALDDEAGARAVLHAARIATIDPEAKRLFGMGRVDPNQPLESLVKIWEQRREGAPLGWVDELVLQVKQASGWQYPQFRWQLMRSVNPADWAQYAPILSRVRSVPRQRLVEFDVYFNRFDTDDRGALQIAFVDEPLVHSTPVPSVAVADI